MCRCYQLRDRVNLVCTTCHYSRKGFREKSIEQTEKCPICQNKLTDIGSKIAIPKKSDKKGWKELQELISKTEYFSVCQC